MTPMLLEVEKVDSQRLHIRPGDGPIIVASDGGAPAATALAVAKLLRERTGSEIRVVSVVEPTAAVVPAPMLVNVPVPESRVELRHAIVREQIDRIVGDDPELPPAAEVETRILVGHPAFELADMADYVRADLLVLGHRERNMWGRLLHSSVAERAYRLASCGVLIVPDRVAARDRAPAREVITCSVADRRHWPWLVAEFTRRNAGRRASVELFSDAMGAQSASVNFPPFGVDCDPETRSVEIMLGDPERRSRRVTHTVHGVTGIELSRVVEGGDFALKLVHDEGETVLAFAV